ncbi:hypothetical protein [Burkholderia ubonensis]|uniref:hypothetical protein n=1 Tax=Burkholderia ubonensis TaxID=101571 RepID=UPI00075CE71C|nr:hypothetical protein [Burkholderia ubonensis]KVC81352.1 hypothetical protein WI75_08340 [Burkholderia ubonensis]
MSKVVSVVIDSLEQRDPVRAGSPFMWAVFFKVDGSTLAVADDGSVTGNCVVVALPGSHGDLGAPTDAIVTVPPHMLDGVDGDGNAIGYVTDQMNVLTWTVSPSIAAFTDRIHPIKVAPSLQPIVGVDKAGGFGVVVAALDEGGHLPEHAAEAGHRAFNTAVEDAINSLLRDLGPGKPSITDQDITDIVGPISQKVHDAIVNDLSFIEKVWALTEADIEIGHKVWRWDQDASSESFSTPADWGAFLWSQSGWAINGHMTINDAPSITGRVVGVYSRDRCDLFAVAGRVALFKVALTGPDGASQTSLQWSVTSPAKIIGSTTGATCEVQMPDPPQPVTVSAVVTVDDGFETYEAAVMPFTVTPWTVEEAQTAYLVCEWWQQLRRDFGYVNHIIVGPGDPLRTPITNDKAARLGAVLRDIVANATSLLESFGQRG